MSAFTLPELIEPGELYIPDGKVGFSTAASVMLNGDNALLMTEETDVEDFVAYQDSIAAGTASRAPHLLDEPACSLSFWIRLNQGFDSGSATITANSIESTAVQAGHRILMGVMDPLAVVAQTPSARTLSWAFLTYSSTQLIFIQCGFYNDSVYYWMTTPVVTLTVGQWHFIVINREQASFSSSRLTSFKGRALLYLDGNLLGGASNTLWTLYPAPVNNQRFSIGDPTVLAKTPGGAAPGAAYNLSKICFHGQQLTPANQLALLDAMRFGPGL